jgi:homoserine dehydrogenase
MFADAVAVPSKTASPTATTTRTVRVGILGLGNVGQAVARLAPKADGLATSAIRFRVLSALVRDVDRPRACLRPPCVTNDADAFLREDYDVVIEALGPVEPARTIVSRVLERGVPVVTANKALMAAHGHELVALATRHRTMLRYEASALAGVPFLGALSERPFVSDVTRFCAVVNGTSNFILSAIDREHCSFDDALRRAQHLGLTEPDPSRDLDGLDAADKFSLLASLFGWGTAKACDLEVTGIRLLGADDLAAARRFDATIKPVVWASRTSGGLEAFVGPVLVRSNHPLASLAGTLSGIQLSGRFVSDLFFSGPGAGPDVTAATILDDAIEAVSSVRRVPRTNRRSEPAGPIATPSTEWFVRVRYPGVVPRGDTALTLLSQAGLAVMSATDAAGDAHWLRVAAAPRERIDRALLNLQRTHRLDAYAIRAI